MPDSLSFTYLLCFLLAGIGIIVLLTTRFKIPAVFALIVASLVVGLGVHMPLPQVFAVMKDGFGSIMKSLGFIILFGTTLGVLLEYTGSTTVMASYIIKKLGQKHTALAISVTGFIVGLPIFCDSGYIVLSGLNKRLAAKSGISMVIMAVSLATGLYAIHCMVPPHPGSAAATGIIGASFGHVILAGIAVAVPAMITGNMWARYAGKKLSHVTPEIDDIGHDDEKYPSVINAFLPVIVPILLISLKSIINMYVPVPTGWLSVAEALGDPVAALLVGVLLAVKWSWTKDEWHKLLHEAVDKSGSILVIIGAGGAFGNLLAATQIGVHLSQVMALGSMGILFPFLLTFLLKTAQGSSTVAIITAANIVQPLLLPLDLATDTGKLLCVLSMGAGSMMISHANDAYFWVVARFSGLDMKTMYRVYSVASIIMGITSLIVVYILSALI